MGTLEPLGACQLKSITCGLPVPLRATVIDEFVDELVLIVSCPVTEPVDEGLNISVTVRV
jgi:hypothetical protein